MKLHERPLIPGRVWRFVWVSCTLGLRGMAIVGDDVLEAYHLVA